MAGRLTLKKMWDAMGRTRNFDLTEALDRATREFWDKGYAGTSLDDLTEAMGIARPSLYRAFGNKEQLFRRVVEHFEIIYLDFVDDALATHPRSEEHTPELQSLLRSSYAAFGLKKKTK